LEAVLAQFAGAKIQLEYPETEPPVEVKVFLHEVVNARRERVYHLTEFQEIERRDIF
jgi:hypothetical protein